MIHLCYWVFQIAVQSVRLKNWMKFIEKASQPRVLKRNVDCQSTWEPLRVIIFLDWIIVNFALLIHFFLFKWRAYLILHSVILSRNRTADENLCRRNFVTSSSLKMSFLLFLAFPFSSLLGLLIIISIGVVVPIVFVISWVAWKRKQLQIFKNDNVIMK